MERVLLADGAVDLVRGEVVRGERVLHLTTAECALLAYVAARPGRLVSREELHREVWGHADSVVSRASDYTVLRLRRKIERIPNEPAHLLTVYGEGYRFEPATPVPRRSGRVALLVALPDPETPAQPWLARVARTARELAADMVHLEPDRVVLALADLDAARAAAARLHADGPARIGIAEGEPELLVHPMSGRTLYAGPPFRRAMLAARGAPIGETSETEPDGAPRTNLRRRSDRFVGREDARDRARDAVEPVVVVGPAGAGKSRLAEQIALDSGLPAWWVSLADTLTDGDVAQALRRELGIGADADPEAVLPTRGPMLIVLDEAEGATGPAARWIERLRGTGLRLVVTSRHRVEVPGAVEIGLGGLPAAEGVALLRARGASGTDAGLAELVARLDGLPLALELAAPRLRVMSPAELAERLDREPEPAGSDRHRSMAAALAASWALLGRAERRVLVQATVFAAPFGLRDAEAVLDPGAADAWIVDVVHTLCDKHLLDRLESVDRPGEWRFTLLASVRAFAMAEGERTPAWLGKAARRHAEHVAAGLATMPEHGVVPDLHARVSEGLRACAVSLAAGWAELATRAWVLAGSLAWGVMPVEPVLALAPDIDDLRVPDLAARVAYVWSMLAFAAGDHETALTMGVRAERRAEGRPALAGRAATMVARVSLQLGDLDGSLSAAERAERAFVEAGDARHVSHARSYRARVLTRRGRLSDALEVAALTAEAAEGHERAGALGEVGSIEFLLGRVDAAIVTLGRALDGMPPMHHLRRGAVCQTLGAALAARGETVAARARLDDAVRLATVAGGSDSVAIALLSHAQLDLEAGDLPAVRLRLAAAEPISTAARIRAEYLALRAEERAASGDAATARDLGVRVGEALERCADATVAFQLRIHLAMVQVYAGDAEGAARASVALDAEVQRLGVLPASPIAQEATRLRRALRGSR